MCRMATVAGQRTANTQREQWTSRQDTPPPGVTCVGQPGQGPLCAEGSGPEVLVKVERPERSEDVRP